MAYVFCLSQDELSHSIGDSTQLSIYNYLCNLKIWIVFENLTWLADMTKDLQGTCVLLEQQLQTKQDALPSLFQQLTPKFSVSWILLKRSSI